MYSWQTFYVPRFYGLDQKTNVVDVKDSESIDCQNVFQDKWGVVSKRRGNDVVFASDSTGSSIRIDEVGSCKLGSTDYYFKFADGDFFYSTSVSGATTALSPTPAIAIGGDIWWAVLDDKLFFVDGSNVLRYFDGSSIKVSSIYERPTIAPTGGAGAGFDYSYTVDNGLGESAAAAPPNTRLNTGSAQSMTIQGNTGPQTLVAGDVVKIYSKATTVAASWKLVATYTWTAADVTATNAVIATTAIVDELENLYTDLGAAINKTAPTGLTGITVHYGRLVGWMGDHFYNSKISNPHAWPDNAAVGEAFVYGFNVGNGESITRCISYLESLFVMKPTDMIVCGGIGPDDTGGNAYSLRRIETNGIGCISGKSAQVIGEDEGNMLIFLSKQGFYASTGSEPIRIGEKIEGNIQGVSSSILVKSHSVYHKRDGFYYCFVGADGGKTAWIIDTHKDEKVLVGWFKITGINATCSQWDNDRYLFGTSNGMVLRERNSGTDLDFSDIAVNYVAAGGFNAGSDEITISNNLQTGTPIRVRTTGTIPAGITANQVYYVINVSPTVIKIAASASDATANIAVDFTTSGVGTHTLIFPVAISSHYTTNWIKFKNPALVKKLAKPLIILNAAASQINLTMESAYDWAPSFLDPQVISITSNHLWGDGTWGSFSWAGGVVATPKNVAISRRKCRSVRYKFSNAVLNQDFDLQGIEQNYAYIRNRGNFA